MALIQPSERQAILFQGYAEVPVVLVPGYLRGVPVFRVVGMPFRVRDRGLVLGVYGAELFVSWCGLWASEDTSAVCAGVHRSISGGQTPVFFAEIMTGTTRADCSDTFSVFGATGVLTRNRIREIIHRHRVLHFGFSTKGEAWLNHESVSFVLCDPVSKTPFYSIAGFLLGESELHCAPDLIGDDIRKYSIEHVVFVHRLSLQR